MLVNLLRSRVIAAFLFSWCWVPAALAQAPFQIQAQSAGNTILVANDSTVTLSASAVGASTTLTLTLTYEGTTSATVNTPQLFGQANSFSLGSSSSVGTALQNGQSASVSVTYTAVTATEAVGQLSIPYTEAGATSGSSTIGTLGLTLEGTAPNLIVTYTLPTNGNVVTVASGNTVTVPATVVGTSITVQMDVVNQGSGSGTLQSIQLMGSDPSFSLISLPLLTSQGLSIAAGGYAQFGVVYAPNQIGTDSDTLQIGLPNQTITLGLQGTSIASLLSYQLVQGTTMTPITPGQTLSFTSTNVGSTSSVTVQVQNTSTTTVTGIDAAVSGTGAAANGSSPFSITNGPILPLSLNVNQTQDFTITFAPTQAGAATGTFRVGNDSFNLSATAIGTLFTYTYTSGSASNTVVPGGTISFSPVNIGQSVSSTFTIQNTGTTTATITSIGINPQTSPSTFAISSPPQLPLSLPAGKSTQFTVTFSPQTTGLATAMLVIDDQQFTLSGFGNALPALPSYQFTGASGNQTPMTQVNVGLTLASSYPVAINGKLTITVNSGNLPADPAVQFATSGQTVDFTIPQGSTQAVFPSGSNQIGLQTGTVAGTITLTPSFAIPSGTDITPASPATVSLTVPASPVYLVNALVSAQAQNSVTLQIIGYATTRTLSQLQFQFTPESNASLTNTSSTITVPIQSYAEAWFNSTQSQTYGGQFVVTVPFSLTTSGSTSTNLLTLLQSVSITAANQEGTSNAVAVSLTQ
jgi:hypothetical protein